MCQTGGGWGAETDESGSGARARVRPKPPAFGSAGKMEPGTIIISISACVQPLLPRRFQLLRDLPRPPRTQPGPRAPARGFWARGSAPPQHCATPKLLNGCGAGNAYSEQQQPETFPIHVLQCKSSSGPTIFWFWNKQNVSRRENSKGKAKQIPSLWEAQADERPARPLPQSQPSEGALQATSSCKSSNYSPI